MRVSRGPGSAGEPFPHVNDATDFARRQQDQYRHIARMLLPALAATAAGGALDWSSDSAADAGDGQRAIQIAKGLALPPSVKFAGSSQVSKFARSASHSWSRIENQAVSRFMPLKMRC